jgi:BESS motif
MNYYRLEESFKSGHEMSTSYAKETSGDGSDNDRIILVEEHKEIFEIKLREDEYEDETRAYKEEDHLLDSYEERIEDPIEEEYMMEQEEIIHEKKINDDQFEVYEMEADQEEELEQPEEDVQPSIQIHHEIQHQLQEPLTSTAVASTAKNVVDPDERYLMSCLPALKRFTPQQKAMVRMGIERLFYETEFENNVSEPRTKRSRQS